MKYTPVIGLEIHIEIIDKKKTFSPTEIDSYSWTSLGFVGTLPTINFSAIKTAIKLSHALSMNINHQYIVFDRKNYFYYDLPRGFQLTQFFHPIGKNGYIQIFNDKKIQIKQLHLEEDTAKQQKNGHFISLDFSRLGKPLIEIVTEPVFTSFEEIKDFLKILKSICLFLDISSCEYENGEIRVDLNISLKLSESTTTEKVEVKNLNSITAIKNALEFQVKALNESLEKNETIESHTSFWIEKTMSCQVSRKKGNFADYFYIPEANIPPTTISEEELKKIIYENQNFYDFINELKNENLSEKEINNMLNKYELFQEIKDLNSVLKDWKKSYIWIAVTFEGIKNPLDKQEYKFEEIKKLIIKVEESKDVDVKTAKQMLKEIINNKLSARDAYKLHKVTTICDKDELLKIIKEIIKENEDQLDKLMANMIKFEKLIVALTMKKTNGQANAKLTIELFKDYINKNLLN